MNDKRAILWGYAVALFVGAMLLFWFLAGCVYDPTAIAPPPDTDAGCTPGENGGDCCGNGLCEPWETEPGAVPTFCPSDCHCGDGVCDPGYGEDQPALFCAADCGCEAIDDCSGTQAPAGCWCRPDCSASAPASTWPVSCCPDACDICGDGCEEGT